MKTITEHYKFEKHENVNDTLHTFWYLQTVIIELETKPSRIDNAHLEKYDKAVKFKNNVQLLWNETAVELTGNYESARKILYSLNKKLEKYPEFYETYASVIIII